jgi:hypothetical protein
MALILPRTEIAIRSCPFSFFVVRCYRLSFIAEAVPVPKSGLRQAIEGRLNIFEMEEFSASFQKER